MAKKAPTKEERHWYAMIAEHGCVICRRPCEVHHLLDGAGWGQKSSNMESIGLCPDHHRNGGHGKAIHAGCVTWENNFGKERVLLAALRDEIYGEGNWPSHLEDQRE